MTKTINAFIIGLAMMLLAQSSMAESPAAGTISVCELAKDLASVRDKLIVLRAIFITDRQHGHALIDNRCPVLI